MRSDEFYAVADLLFVLAEVDTEGAADGIRRLQALSGADAQPEDIAALHAEVERMVGLAMGGGALPS